MQKALFPLFIFLALLSLAACGSSDSKKGSATLNDLQKHKLKFLKLNLEANECDAAVQFGNELKPGGAFASSHPDVIQALSELKKKCGP